MPIRSKYPRGEFNTTVKNLRRRDGRYTLSLYLTDYDCYIIIDIHNHFYENFGSNKLSNQLIKKIASNLPINIIVSNLKGFWEIKNESQILSDAISKSF